MHRHPSSGTRAFVALLVASLCMSLCACGGSGSTALAPTSDVGRLLEKPGGGLYYVDEHQRGQARAPRLAETSWGRMVDVHDVDASGEPSPEPLLIDLLVRPDVRSDGNDFALQSDALGRTRLVVLHPHGTPAFEDALGRAAQTLPTLAPKDDDGSSSAPFPFVARDAALVLRFDDLLEDDDETRAGLAEAARVLVGYPPRGFQPVRVFFDENHGAADGDGFHPTRVVIDFTISALELPAPNPLPVNPIGLPASLLSTLNPNVSVRLASREDFGSGVFSVLRNLRGRALVPEENGPRDEGSPTLDVVRALRSGNVEDPDNGFLADRVRPALVGRWNVTVSTAVRDAAEPAGFVLSLAFTSACAKALVPGELLETEAGFLAITHASAAPDANGEIAAVHARAPGASVPSPAELLGPAHVRTTLTAASSVDPACFVEVLDDTVLDPGAPIPPTARFRVRFNEPMDPDSFVALESLRLFSGAEAGARNSVIGSIRASAEADAFDLEPRLPLAHERGTSEAYVLELVSGSDSVTDLAGNTPHPSLPAVSFRLDADANGVASSGLGLRFDRPDEYERPVDVLSFPAARTPSAGEPPVRDEDISPGGPDLRGVFTYDSARGMLRPRPVARQSWPIDRSIGLATLMQPLPVGVREPLGRLGSRVQTLWRYADAGWKVADETRYDLDVEGLAWAPFGGDVLADFIEAFEVRLAHSTRLPDEGMGATGLSYPNSGLLDAPARFLDNVLEPEGARPVNERTNGYLIQRTDRFQATTGTFMLPFPVESGGTIAPFTWRDTSLQGLGGADGGGIPMLIEKRLDPSLRPGSLARAGQVPSIGLPLLIELFAFHSDGILGLNDFQVAIASPGQLQPNFRVHSTGGQDGSSHDVVVDPDLAAVPSGGFNSTSSPPGQRTRSADPTLYFGQLDTVTRVTRVHTVWFDAESEDPDYFAPLLEPAAERQPAGTRVLLDFRGALGFVHTQGAESDATRLDAYGEVSRGSVLYPEGKRGWSPDVDAIDGLRYFQIRISFVNSVEGDVSPEVDSLGVPFLRR